VTVTTTVTYYHHQTISGDMTPEDAEVVRQNVDSVTCVWCGNGGNVEVMKGPDTTE
jgi:hypothetical protein